MINQSYKKLQIWVKAMELAKLVYKLTANFPKEELFGLTSQMRRSSVSVVSNIAEGSQRSTDKDFAHFILTGKGSLAELETQTLLAQSFNYGSGDSIMIILDKIAELDKMLYAFYRKLTVS